MLGSFAKKIARVLNNHRRGSNNDTDPIQKFFKVGKYSVGTQKNTPGGGDYTLTVYRDDHGALHQALDPEESGGLAATCVRHFDSRLGGFRAFQNEKTGVRYNVTDYLDTFLGQIEPQIRSGNNSINIGVLTGTHYKTTDSVGSHGNDDSVHVREFNHLGKSGLLHLEAHLDDWIDGSDAGLIGENELIKPRNSFKNTRTLLTIIKGNHDENDKFDEHHDLKAGFPENEFERVMWPIMYAQKGLKYVSQYHGVAYFDRDDLRAIFVDTSDVPCILNEQGKKKYDTKLTLAIQEDQIEELIEILSSSSGKKITLLNHGNPINRRSGNALRHNGRSLHELLVAFNQREKGRMHSHNVPPKFTLSNDFNLTNVENAKVIAYFCGHRHVEDQSGIDGVRYILFNCSALVRPGYALTTKYDKNWSRQIDGITEFAGYVVNIDLVKSQIQVFGYGAASFRRVFNI